MIMRIAAAQEVLSIIGKKLKFICLLQPPRDRPHDQQVHHCPQWASS